eukprot:TRINITY_DN8906_c0_g1_i2.p1 TRINITY_DN8906_c0_g1~~TRINITY_DN8906_c0_g1_i2.p1  ORF type:complete len:569 (+),score=118.27 TRINITY_DN8906_c0_g1_i2:180-1886(+)
MDPFMNLVAGMHTAMITIRSVKETTQKRQGEDDDGNKTINQYSIVGDLGQGAYSKVKLAVDNETDEVRAMKVMKKTILNKTRSSSGSAMDNVARELALLKKMNHKNVVKLYEVINDAEDDKMYMVLEYLEKGNLLKIEDDGTTGGKVFSISEARNAMLDIINGISFLHQHLIFHRDIKPENLLLGGDGTVKVSDFGVSISFDTEEDASQMKFFEGTPVFLSPEVVEGRSSVDAGAVDIWAVGVTFYAMLFGRLPFFATTIPEVTSRILKSPFHIPDTFTDKPTISLLEGLLDKNPETRFTLEQIMQHEFFQSSKGIDRDRFGAVDTITVSAEEIANAFTERKWTNLSFMFLKVRSKLRSYKEKARSNLELKSPQTRSAEEKSFTHVDCENIEIPYALALDNENNDTNGDTEEKDDDDLLEQAEEEEKEPPVHEEPVHEDPVHESPPRKRSLDVSLSVGGPCGPRNEADDALSKKKSTHPSDEAVRLSGPCVTPSRIHSDTAYSSDTATPTRSDTAYPVRRTYPLSTPYWLTPPGLQTSSPFQTPEIQKFPPTRPLLSPALSVRHSKVL